MKLKQCNLPSHLPEAENIEQIIDEARREERDITAVLIKDACITGLDCSTAGFSKVHFQHCQLTGCKLRRASFLDVCFDSCDFSNADFSDSYFARCRFSNCKGIGAGFSDGRLQDIMIEGGNLKYSNFMHSRLKGVSIRNSDLSGADFSECNLKQIELSDVRFTGATFARTPLSGIDFTSSDITGIQVIAECRELKGAVVGLHQAAELAQLLGVSIK